MLLDLQRLLEATYRIDPLPDIRDFVLTDPEVADALAPSASSAREALLIREGRDGLELSLYLDPADRAALEEPVLDLDRLMRAAEGVSHFVLVAWRALRDLPVSRLELELQAEVDKFVILLLADAFSPHDLVEALFVRARLRDDLTADEAHRYQQASDLARAYCRSLPDRRREDLLSDVRRFWRYGQREKMAHIARLAA